MVNDNRRSILFYLRLESYAENIAGALRDVRHNGLNVIVGDLSCHGIQIHR